MSTDASFDVSLDYNTLVTEIDAIVDINSKCYELLSTICEASDAVGMLESGYLLINAFNTVDDIINGPIKNTLMHIMDVESLFNIFQNKDFYADYFSNVDADGDGNPDIDYDKLLTVMVSLVNTQEECFQLVDNYDEVLERYSVMLRELDEQIAIYEQSEIVDLNSFDRDYIVQQIEKQNEALSNLPQLRSEYAELANIMAIVKNIRDYTLDKGFFLYGGDENFDSLSGDIDIRIVDAKLVQNKDYKGTLFGDDPENQFYWEFYDKDGNVLTEDDVSIIETSIFFANQEKYTVEGCTEKFAEYSRAYSYLNEQEVKIANYLYNSGNFDKLEEFLLFKESYANGREGAERAQEILAKIDGYYANALTDSQKNVAYAKTLSLLAGTGFVDGWGSFFEGFSNLVAADGEVSVEQYKTMEIIKALNSKDENAIGKLFESDWQTLGATGSYEIFNSIGNMAPSMIVGAITKCPQLGSALMGISAAGNAREQGLQAGMSNLEAWQYGILSGASESATEFLLGGIPYLSSADELTDLFKNPMIRKIINANPKAMKFFNSGLYRYGENMVSEGIEEMFQTGILEPVITTYVTGEVPDVSLGEVLKSGAYGMVSSGITQGAVNTGKGVLNLAVNHSLTNGPTIILDKTGYSMKNMSDEFISDFVGKYGNQDLSNPDVLAQVKADLAPYIVGVDSNHQKGSDTTIPVVPPKSKIPPSAQQAKKIVETARTVIEEQGGTLPNDTPVMQGQERVIDENVDLDVTVSDELTFEHKAETGDKPIVSHDAFVSETPVIVEEKTSSEMVEDSPIVSDVVAEDLVASVENEVRAENISSDNTQSSTDMTSGLAVSGLATAVAVSQEALSTKVNGDIDTPVLASDIVVDDGSNTVTSEFDLDDETEIDVVSENVTVNLQDKSNKLSTEEQVSGTIVTDDFLHEVTDEEFEDGTELGPDERLAGRIGFQYFAKPKTNSGTVVDGLGTDMTVQTDEVNGTVTDVIEVDLESGDISVDTTIPRNILIDGKNFIVKMCTRIKDFVSAKSLEQKIASGKNVNIIIDSVSESAFRLLSTESFKGINYIFHEHTPDFVRTDSNFIISCFENSDRIHCPSLLEYADLSVLSESHMKGLIEGLVRRGIYLNSHCPDILKQNPDYILKSIDGYLKNLRYENIGDYHVAGKTSVFIEIIENADLSVLSEKQMNDVIKILYDFKYRFNENSPISLLQNPKFFDFVLNTCYSYRDYNGTYYYDNSIIALLAKVDSSALIDKIIKINYVITSDSPAILKSNINVIISSLNNAYNANSRKFDFSNVERVLTNVNFSEMGKSDLDQVLSWLRNVDYHFSKNTPSSLADIVIGDILSYESFVYGAIDCCSTEVLKANLDSVLEVLNKYRYIDFKYSKNAQIIADGVISNPSKYSALVSVAVECCTTEVLKKNLVSVLPMLEKYTFLTGENGRIIVDYAADVLSCLNSSASIIYTGNSCWQNYQYLVIDAINSCDSSLLTDDVLSRCIPMLGSDFKYKFPNGKKIANYVVQNHLVVANENINILVEAVDCCDSSLLTDDVLGRCIYYLSDIPVKSVRNRVVGYVLSEYGGFVVSDNEIDDFKAYIGSNFNIEFILENASSCYEIYSRLKYTNSKSLYSFGKSLMPQLLVDDNPIKKFEEIEKIFVKNNLPLFGKQFLAFKILYPDLGNFDFSDSSRMSPQLKEQSLGKVKIVDRFGKKYSFNDIRFNIIYNDLLRIAVRTNNLNLREYLVNLDKGNSLFFKILIKQIAYDSLSGEDKLILEVFVSHLETLYLNTVSGKNAVIDLSQYSVIDKIKLFKEKFKVTDRYDLKDRIVRSFGYSAGITSFNNMISVMDSAISEADDRGRQYADVLGTDGRFMFEVGDFVRGIGDYQSLSGSLTGGNVSNEYLTLFMGTSSSDTTPLDIDITMIDGKRHDINNGENSTSIYSSIAGTSTGFGFGNVYVIIKKDNPNFNITRDQDGNLIDTKYDPSKVELFGTHVGLFGAEMHWGARTGIAITDVDYILYKRNCEINSSMPYDENGNVSYTAALSLYDFELDAIKFEIARHGFYMPVIDFSGKLIFTPAEYDALRCRMFGLSYYGVSTYEFSHNLVAPGITELVSKFEYNDEVTRAKRDKIDFIMRKVFSEYGFTLSGEVTGDLTPGIVDLIDTGSTGRNTNKIGDGDFDFLLRVDQQLFMDTEKYNQFKQDILDILKQYPIREIGVTSDGDYRLKGVQIDADTVVDIDISFAIRTDKIDYSSDMCLKDRLKTMKKLDFQKYKYAVSNVILAKQILKDAGVYKPYRNDPTQGGLGGIGVENWVLQHGGSFVDAAESFVRAALGDDWRISGRTKVENFDVFKLKYTIWDFGQNHFSEKKGKYLYDNFVDCNMSKDGYERMVSALKTYLASVEGHNFNYDSNGGGNTLLFNSEMDDGELQQPVENLDSCDEIQFFAKPKIDTAVDISNLLNDDFGNKAITILLDKLIKAGKSDSIISTIIGRFDSKQLFEIINEAIVNKYDFVRVIECLSNEQFVSFVEQLNVSSVKDFLQIVSIDKIISVYESLELSARLKLEQKIGSYVDMKKLCIYKQMINDGSMEIFVKGISDTEFNKLIDEISKNEIRGIDDLINTLISYDSDRVNKMIANHTLKFDKKLPDTIRRIFMEPISKCVKSFEKYATRKDDSNDYTSFGIDQNVTRKHVEFRVSDSSWMKSVDGFVEFVVNDAKQKNPNSAMTKEQALEFANSIVNGGVFHLNGYDVVVKYLVANYSDNQVMEITRTSFTRDESPEYKRILKKLVSKNMDVATARRILDCINTTGVCSYATIANFIFDYYKDIPEVFKKEFGFDLFVEIDGVQRINEIELLTDMYITINSSSFGGKLFNIDSNGMIYTSKNIKTEEQLYLGDILGLNLDVINKYLQLKHSSLFINTETFIYSNKERKYINKDKNVVSLSPNSLDLTVDFIEKTIIDNLIKGKYVTLGLYKSDKAITFRNADDSIFCSTLNWDEDGGHGVYVVGIDIDTDSIIVSSWGKKLYIPVSDLIDNIFNIDVVSPNFDLNNNVSDIDDNLNTDSDVDTNIDSDTDSSLGKKIVGFAKKVGKAVLTTYLTSLGMMAISGLLDGIETMESVSEASDDVLDSFFDNDNNDDNVDDDGEIFASPSDDFDENDFSNDFLESIEDDVNLNDEISNDNIINDIFEENIIVGEKNSISNEIYSDENSDIESNLKDNIGEDNNDVLDEKFNFSEGFILPSINRKNNNSKTKLVSLLSLFGLLSASGVVMYNSKKKDEEELDDESIFDDEEILSDIDSDYEKPTFYSDKFKN